MKPAGAARAVTRLARVALLSSIVLPVAGASQAADGLGPPPLGLDLYMSVLPDNAVTRKKVELGRMLFFDPLLSRDRSVSCASCHKPRAAFADTRARSRGVGGREPLRNTPSIVNAG